LTSNAFLDDAKGIIDFNPGNMSLKKYTAEPIIILDEEGG
jgi:hypothetical protein